MAKKSGMPKAGKTVEKAPKAWPKDPTGGAKGKDLKKKDSDKGGKMPKAATGKGMKACK